MDNAIFRLVFTNQDCAHSSDIFHVKSHVDFWFPHVQVNNDNPFFRECDNSRQVDGYKCFSFSGDSRSDPDDLRYILDSLAGGRVIVIHGDI